MIWRSFLDFLALIQHGVSLIGISIIIYGVLISFYQYLQLIYQKKVDHGHLVNAIRLNLGRTLILGLEFIVSADLIGTITAPDYYEVGLLAIIVLIRTLLTFSINREIAMLKKE